MPCSKQRRHSFLALQPGLLHVRRSISKHGVRHDDVGRIYRQRRNAACLQKLRQQHGRQPLADGHRFVYRTRRSSAQHQNAAGNPVKFRRQRLNRVSSGFAKPYGID